MPPDWVPEKLPALPNITYELLTEKLPPCRSNAEEPKDAAEPVTPEVELYENHTGPVVEKALVEPDWTYLP